VKAVAVPVPENSPIKAGVNPAGTGAGTGSGIAPAIAAASAPTSAAPSAQPREPAPAAKPLAATASAPAPKPDDSERVKALLDGKPAPEVSATGEPRLVVQVGAYADAAKAREARLKVEKAGLKTYTQVVDTKDGKRTRVRVGPFTSKEEADKAVTRIKALDLPASILTL
jgi:DedD protein